MSRVRTAALLLFLLSVAFQTTFIGLDVFSSDEGLPLVAAADVAAGKLLYRDCYVPVTPLAYLVQAGVFKIFGIGFLQSRLLMAVVYALCVVMVFAIATTCVPFGFAVLAGIASILLQVWTWPHAQYFSYTPLAVLLSLLSIYLAWSIEISSRRLWCAMAFGAALGLSAWAKPNIGAMTGVGVLVYWLTALARSFAGSPTLRARSLSTVLQEGMATLAGVLLVSVPLLGYLIATDTLAGMIESLRALAAIYKDVPPDLFPKPFPFTGQIESLRVNSGLLMPGMFSASLLWVVGYEYLLSYTAWFDVLVRVVYYAPIVVMVVVCAHLLARLRRRAWAREDEASLLLVLVTLALYLTIAPHAAVHYLMPAQLPAIVLACFIHARACQASRARVRELARMAFSASWSLYFALSLFSLGVYLSIVREPVHTSKGTLWMDPLNASALEEVLSYVSEEIPADAAVFAFPYYPLFYFVSDVRHATRFVDLRPGSPGVAAEDEIIRQLEDDHVEFAIYFVGTQYPGVEYFDSAYPRLHHYIMSHFELERPLRTYFGKFAEVRRRRPSQTSAAADDTSSAVTR